MRTPRRGFLQIAAGAATLDYPTRPIHELIVTPLVLTPAEFGAYMTAETAKWAKVIKLANIKAE